MHHVGPDLVHFIVFFGSALCLLLTIAQMIRKWDIRNVLLGSFFFSLGINIFYIGMVTSERILALPEIFLINIPFIYLTGPLVFFYIKLITEYNYTLKTRQLLHFIPTLLSIAWMVPVWILPADTKLVILREIIFENKLGNIPYYTIPGITLIIGYILLLIRENNPFIEFKNSLNWIIGFLLLAWVTSLMFGVVFIINHSIKMLTYVALNLSLSIIYIFLVSQRYPNFMVLAAEMIKSKKYEKTQLSGINLNEIEASIKKLMDEKQLYSDQALSLASLAKEIGITSHQLSEYLNNILKQNFSRFINNYRIDRARDLLRNQPDKTILEIAMEVGFNSLSAFQNAFQNAENISPGGYRKRQLK